MSQYVNNPEEAKELLPRYKLFYLALTFTVLLFGGRLWHLQIIQGTELRNFSERNRIKRMKVMAPRGKMLDREGRDLVLNNSGVEAVLSPQYVEDLDEVAAKLAPILGTDAEKLAQKVERSRKQNGPFAQIKLKENLSMDEVARLMRLRLDTPGLEVREVVVRHYPMGENGSQLFGYVGEISKKQLPIYNQEFKGLTFEQGDLIGKSGLEQILEREIRGQDGYELLQVDAYGREAVKQNAAIYGQEIRNQEYIPGSNIVLTIDKDIQDAAWRAMTKLGRIGGLVVMKSNGEVLAWVSNPSFDPNAFSRTLTMSLWNKLVNDPFKPLRNKVIQDHYAPGSTFKPFMALAALEEKIITPSTVIFSPGSLRFGRREYHESVRGGLGNVTVYDAIERSSNIFFYKMGMALGIDRMYNYISPLGLGQRTGIEVPREVTGNMPNAAWKLATKKEEWQPGENLSNAIGQGFVQTTPLQMAVAYNAIGLEGKVVRPFVIQKIVDVDGKMVKENQSQIIRDLTQKQTTGISISPETFKIVKEGMRRVIHGQRGTARLARIPGVEMAGKTGTAQAIGFTAADVYTRCENRPLHARPHGWFVAFAPVEQPEITVAAFAEHGCHGSTGAGPLVKEVMQAYFAKFHSDWLAEGLRKEKDRKVEVVRPDEVEGE